MLYDNPPGQVRPVVTEPPTHLGQFWPTRCGVRGAWWGQNCDLLGIKTLIIFLFALEIKHTLVASVVFALAVIRRALWCREGVRIKA